MSDAEAILNRARSLGVQISKNGDPIALSPAKLCQSDLVDALRHHKQQVLEILDAELHPLQQDCVPWLHIARKVLAGEFAGCDGSTRESLTIGLRSINHPLAQKALESVTKSTNRL